jgi:acetamidase/formamidase
VDTAPVRWFLNTDFSFLKLEKTMKNSTLSKIACLAVICLILSICSSVTLFAQKTHTFKPAHYYFTYDAKHEPVLKLKPGDTLITSTLDAFGNAITTAEQKASDIVHLPKVNHQTGPFYVEGAEPGDTLVIHLLKIMPNRDFAVSTHLPHFGVLSGETYTAMLTKPLPEKTYIWKLDFDNNVGELDLPESQVEKVEIPLRPFLGTVGVAPNFGEAIISLTPAEHGGNMDCVETKEGTTLYFPVFVEGALFMLGDGHAAQGDGEICGTGLECPMDVTVKVDVIKGKTINWPRMEDDGYIMVASSTRPAIDAFRSAHVELINWLVDDYGYDRWDALQIVSQVGRTRIGNVVDPKYTVVAKFPKKYLPNRE